MTSEQTLHIDVAGFEGPLDLLLTLARSQKVDLREISIVALVNQYLLFVEQARKTRLELAADYLVMAAWLAYLKSRLLLPNATKLDEPSGEALAETLALKLQRLAIIREAAGELALRPRLNRDYFARGELQDFGTQKKTTYTASLYELLLAYGQQRQTHEAEVRVEKRTVVSLKEARTLLERMIGLTFEWTSLESFLHEYLSQEKLHTTLKASAFSAMLEMVREGAVELSQANAFAPIYLRTRSGTA